MSQRRLRQLRAMVEADPDPAQIEFEAKALWRAMEIIRDQAAARFAEARAIRARRAEYEEELARTDDRQARQHFGPTATRSTNAA